MTQHYFTPTTILWLYLSSDIRTLEGKQRSSNSNLVNSAEFEVQGLFDEHGFARNETN